MKVEDIINRLEPKRDLPVFRVGDTLRVHVRIAEGDKERIQVFEGTVIKRRRGGSGASFTVRKVSYGIGVERVFPMKSRAVEMVEVIARAKARRARLYYLRKKRSKEIETQDVVTTANKEAKAEAAEQKKAAAALEASAPTITT